MNIVFGHDVAKQLREKYFVLELETFDANDGPSTAFCVLSPESIVLTDLPDMDRLGRLHAALIGSFNEKNFEQVLEILPHLKGKFSGEMDSFYKVIEEKVKAVNEYQ